MRKELEEGVRILVFIIICNPSSSSFFKKIFNFLKLCNRVGCWKKIKQLTNFEIYVKYYVIIIIIFFLYKFCFYEISFYSFFKALVFLVFPFKILKFKVKRLITYLFKK